MKKQIAAGLLVVCMLITGLSGVIIGGTALVTEAAGKNVKICESDDEVAIVSGQKARLSIRKGGKITSSNPKVASVNRKGIITTAALGTSEITYTGKKGKKRTVTITVVPERENDIDFIPDEALAGKTIQPRIRCDKYDTSQLDVKYYDYWGEEYSAGNIMFTNPEDMGYRYTWTNSSVEIKYGEFEKVEGVNVYSTDFFDDVPLEIETTLSTMDASAWNEKYEAVFNRVFDIVRKQTNAAMSEREKVKALHDYLIYNANYYNQDGDIPDWAYSAYGVLMRGEGVCDSYAKAFYMLCKSAGIECLKIHGETWSEEPGHAWNKVKIDGVWYYVDCTWDDPIDYGGYGGYEQDKYFLSETLWEDHTKYLEYPFDLATEKLEQPGGGRHMVASPFQSKGEEIDEWVRILYRD